MLVRFPALGATLVVFGILLMMGSKTDMKELGLCFVILGGLIHREGVVLERENTGSAD